MAGGAFEFPRGCEGAFDCPRYDKMVFKFPRLDVWASNFPRRTEGCPVAWLVILSRAIKSSSHKKVGDWMLGKSGLPSRPSSCTRTWSKVMGPCTNDRFGEGSPYHGGKIFFL